MFCDVSLWRFCQIITRCRLLKCGWQSAKTFCLHGSTCFTKVILIFLFGKHLKRTVFGIIYFAVIIKCNDPWFTAVSSWPRSERPEWSRTSWPTHEGNLMDWSFYIKAHQKRHDPKWHIWKRHIQNGTYYYGTTEVRTKMAHLIIRTWSSSSLVLDTTCV